MAFSFSCFHGELKRLFVYHCKFMFVCLCTNVALLLVFLDTILLDMMKMAGCSYHSAYVLCSQYFHCSVMCFEFLFNAFYADWS